MRFKDIFTSRSFHQDPFGTFARGIEWSLRSLTSRARNYEIEFGDRRFSLALQSMKRGYGSAGIFVQRKYYEPLLEFGHRLLSPGDRVIDGGANQGVYTCAFSSLVGAQGHVFAFEPQPYAVSCIRTNLKLNGLDNVTIFEGALAGESGEIYLVLDRGPVAAFISSQPIGTNRQKVRSFCIDDLSRQGAIGDCQFIKLDVEGAEMSVLKGARGMIERAAPRICIEASNKGQLEQIVSFLATLGYRAYEFDIRGNLNAFAERYPCPNVFFMR